MRLIYICFLITISGFFTITRGQYDLNLDFEKRTAKGEVKGYGTEGRGYKYFLDSTVFLTGNKSLCVEYTTGSSEKHANFFSLLSGSLFLNKKCRLSGFIKTENVTDFAGFFITILGKDTVVMHATMEKTGPKGTTGWKQYSIEYDIKNDCRQLWFGVEMGEKGKAWFDNLKFEIGGVEVTQPVLSDAALTKERIEWLDKNAFIFKSVNPKESNSDLQFLKTIIGNAGIAAIGEGGYGASESTKMRHRIIKYLTEEMDFSLFFFNVEMTFAKLINDYIQTGEGDPKKVLAGFEYWYDDTQEFLDIIEWIRQYNLSGKKKIAFAGYNYEANEKSSEVIKNFLKKADPEYLVKADSVFSAIADIKFEFKINTTLRANVSYKPVLDKVVELHKYLVSKSDEYETKYDKKEIEWAICCARSLIQMMGRYVPRSSPVNENYYENIKWVRNQHPSGTKFGLFNNNEYVGKADSLQKNLLFYLTEKNPTNAVSFALLYHSGYSINMGIDGLKAYPVEASRQGSIEYMLHGYGKNFLALDLRKTTGTPIDKAFSSLVDTRYSYSFVYDDLFYASQAKDYYDVLIYIDKVTPKKSFRIQSK